MAVFSKGIHGGFSGALGKVVGATWKGIPYMRSMPSKSSRPPSEAQLQQRMKFALCMRFVKPLHALLEVSFRMYSPNKTGINSALSYAMKHAINGIYPDFELNYSQILISRGDLPNIANAEAFAGENGAVEFTWSENGQAAMTSKSDKIITAICCPELRQAIYTIGNSRRESLSQRMDAKLFSGKIVQTYISVISIKSEEAAESIYTGQLQIS